MKLKWTVAALALACTCAPSWAINKCVVDGKAVYQDMPCAGAGEKIEVHPPSGIGERSLDQSIREMNQASAEYIAAIKKESEARVAQAKKVNADCDARGVTDLEIGMSAEDALCVPGWRFPAKFNNTRTPTLFKQQVVYGGFGKYDNPPKYLYFENGKLTAIQE